MPGRRAVGSLAKLERRLAALDAQRHRVIAEILAAVSHLTFGSAAPLAGPDLDAPIRAGVRRGSVSAGGTRRVRPPLSPAARARLSESAKARWAKAKKAGKKTLG